MRWARVHGKDTLLKLLHHPNIGPLGKGIKYAYENDKAINLPAPFLDEMSIPTDQHTVFYKKEQEK